MIPYAIIGFVVLQRLAELWYARTNTRALLAQGATEIGRSHYPLFVILHATWLGAIVWALPNPTQMNWFAVAGYAAFEGLRAWTMRTLGPYWTTRIISLEGTPLVRRGPYRLVRHPNYMIVIAEIVLLPLAFGEVWVAAIFSTLNAMLVLWRIGEEERALAPRRTLPVNGG